jgi:hypothetical protein
MFDARRMVELKEISDQQPHQATVIILGYPYQNDTRTCPYSERVMNILRQTPEWKYLFVTIPFGGHVQPVKNFLGYQGTFPIVLYNTDGHGAFQHIGGSEQLQTMRDLWTPHRDVRTDTMKMSPQVVLPLYDRLSRVQGSDSTSSDNDGDMSDSTSEQEDEE